MLKFLLFSFYFFHFSISHSSVMHREICIKDFSWTAAPRIWRFGTNIMTYCVRESQHSHAYHSLICPFLFFLNKIFRHWFLRNYFIKDFEIYYKHWVWVVVLCKRESAASCLSFSLNAIFHFCLIKIHHRFLTCYWSQSLQILFIPWQLWSMLCKRQPR